VRRQAAVYIYIYTHIVNNICIRYYNNMYCTKNIGKKRSRRNNASVAHSCGGKIIDVKVHADSGGCGNVSVFRCENYRSKPFTTYIMSDIIKNYINPCHTRYIMMYLYGLGIPAQNDLFIPSFVAYMYTASPLVVIFPRRALRNYDIAAGTCVVLMPPTPPLLSVRIVQLGKRSNKTISNNGLCCRVVIKMNNNNKK